MWRMFLFGLVVALAGCIARLPPPQPSQTVSIGASLLDEPFDTASSWGRYHRDDLVADVMSGSYRLDTTLRQYAFVLQSENLADTVIETEFYRLSSGDDVLYGVMCRGQSSGTGYYFLLSGDGSFSIRRGATNDVKALVPWQPTSAINTSSPRQRVRAICAGEYLALYINDQFAGETTDSLYHTGHVGLVATVPPRAPEGTRATLDIDFVRAWEPQ